MTAGRYCNREVVVTGPETSISDAARLMRSHHVGDLVVVETHGTRRVPLGILTDRDLVIEVLAQEVPLDAVACKDVMNAEPVKVGEQETLLDTLSLMRERGVRRILVVDADGGLQGILTADDAIELIAEATGHLVRLVASEIRHERQRRP